VIADPTSHAVISQTLQGDDMRRRTETVGRAMPHHRRSGVRGHSEFLPGPDRTPA